VVWAKLTDAQRDKLTGIGVQPLTEEAPAKAAKASQGASGRSSGAFALRQYKARTGSVTVPRGHVEELAGTDDEAGTLVKLGVWISNTKSRRAKLTADQLAQLADLGLDWYSSRTL
jgi:hypothetical protein